MCTQLLLVYSRTDAKIVTRIKGVGMYFEICCVFV